MSAGKITAEQVKYVAQLARLRLSDDEERKLGSEMDQILQYIDQLNQLDTDSVEPTAQVGDAGTPTRADEVTNQHAPQEMLGNAPARQGGYFKVPKIID